MAVPQRTLNWLYSVLTKVGPNRHIMFISTNYPRTTTTPNKLTTTPIGPTTMLRTRCRNTPRSLLGPMYIVSRLTPDSPAL